MGLEEKTYRTLTQWCERRPIAIALLAPSIAFMADPLERLILDPSWQKHRDRLAPISPENRRRYYQSCTDLMRDFGRDVLIKGVIPMKDACDTLDAIHDPECDPSQLGVECLKVLADVEQMERTRAELLQHIDANCRELAGLSAAQLSETEQEAIEKSPAAAFMFTVMVDYLAHYYRDPQGQFRIAAIDDGSAIEPARPLLAVDPTLVAEPLLRHRLLDGGRRKVRRNLSLVNSALTKGPTKLRKGAVIRAAAGFISCLSHIYDAGLKAPDICELLDLSAQQRKGLVGDSRIRETRLGTGEAITQTLYRERRKWMTWIDPDKNLQTFVRAVRKLAA